MRIQRADIGDSYSLHKLLREFMKDTKQDGQPSAECWLYRFSNPLFFCFVGTHGRQPVCMTWGHVSPFNQQEVHVEGFFVRRKFRGKLRYVRPLGIALKSFLAENKIKHITSFMEAPKYGMKAAKRELFKKQLGG